MKLFVWEYVIGGGLHGAAVPASLVAEGRGMLSALLCDLAAHATSIGQTNERLEISTARDARWPALDIPHVAETVVAPHDDEPARFLEQLGTADRAWLIAPEFDGALAGRIAVAEQRGVPLVNATLDGVRIASDKWACYETWTRANVPTIPTLNLMDLDPFALSAPTDSQPQPSACHWFDIPVAPLWEHLQRTVAASATSHKAATAMPVVIKPRYGAGAQATFVIRSARELAHVVERARAIGLGPNEATERHLLRDAIAQPFVTGRSVSTVVLCAPTVSLPDVRDARSQTATTRVLEVWPVAEQRIGGTNQLAYRGGRLPASLSDAETDTVTRCAIAACEAIPGLAGYIGVDLLLPDAGLQPAVVCEVNPRLTTSYLGYRALAETNLAGHILEQTTRPAPTPTSPLHTPACTTIFASNRSALWKFDAQGAVSVRVVRQRHRSRDEN